MIFVPHIKQHVWASAGCYGVCFTFIIRSGDSVLPSGSNGTYTTVIFEVGLGTGDLLIFSFPDKRAHNTTTHWPSRSVSDTIVLRTVAGLLSAYTTRLGYGVASREQECDYDPLSSPVKQQRNSVALSPQANYTD
jgi:hypothetical protein